MIQRGKDHSAAGGAQRSTPHMTQPNIQRQPQRGALGLDELQWRKVGASVRTSATVTSGHRRLPLCRQLRIADDAESYRFHAAAIILRIRGG